MDPSLQHTPQAKASAPQESAGYETSVAAVYGWYTSSPLRIRASMQTLEDALPSAAAVKLTIHNAVEHFMAEEVNNVVKLHALMRSAEGRATLQRMHDKRFSAEQMQGQEYWAEKADQAPRLWTESALRYLSKLETAVEALNAQYKDTFGSHIEYIASVKSMLLREKQGLDADAMYVADLDHIHREREAYLAFRDEAEADLGRMRSEIHQLEAQRRWALFGKRKELGEKIEKKKEGLKNQCLVRGSAETLTGLQSGD